MKQILLPFNWKIVIFLIILEVFTVPFVAISNSIIISNQIYLGIIGFSVAFIALIIILKLFVQPIKQYLSHLLKQKIIQINGLLYTSLFAGFLLMLMFYLQNLSYSFTKSDCIVGFVSAFFSVSISLIIYNFLASYLGYGVKIKVSDNNCCYLVAFPIKDIIVLTLLFSLYETIASPISLLWLPHYNHRFLWGIIAGILSGLAGGIPLILICHFTKYKITIFLKLIK